ncbi:MAG: AAA family ATPase [Sphaerochaetaceae bacterium]
METDDKAVNILTAIGKTKGLGDLQEHGLGGGCILAKYSGGGILSVAVDGSGEIAPSAEMKPASPSDWDGVKERRTPEDGPGVSLISLADVKTEPVGWLWKDWLPAGMLTILAGAPGCGKTTIALSLAATLSKRNSRWPDGSECTEPGRTVIWSGEDVMAQTIKPRLVAMGADCSRISFCSAVREKSDAGGVEERPFDPAADIPELERTIERMGGVKLLIIDSIASAVAGDAHRNNETREALQPIVDLAGKTGCAVIGITHFSKGTQGRNPTERVNGSLAFGALARMVLVATKGKPGEKRLLAKAKANICSDSGGALQYDIQGTTVQDETTGGDMETSLIEWGDRIAGDVQDLLDEAEGVGRSGRADGGNMEDAVNFLTAFLKDGEHLKDDVLETAKSEGITGKTLRTASERLGIVKTRGKKGESGRKAGCGYWSLPKEPGTAPWNEDDAA